MDLTHNWQYLQVAQDRITARIGQALEAQHSLSAREYTLLRILSTQHDDEGGHFQMKQLSELVGLSQSATTRLIGRMEDRGLLVRYICPTDRRGIYTNVSDQGFELLTPSQKTAEQTLTNLIEQYQEDPQFSRYLKALQHL